MRWRADPAGLHVASRRAVAAAQGKIVYVGGEETARSLCADDATVLDYGDNYVYPGFLEAHCHPGGAGARAIGQANLMPGSTMPPSKRFSSVFSPTSSLAPSSSPT